jgi:hypothetical protein
MKKEEQDVPETVVKVDCKNRCKCEKPELKMVNYSMMWHEADIVCAHCNGFVRYWDAG